MRLNALPRNYGIANKFMKATGILAPLPHISEMKSFDRAFKIFLFAIKKTAW